MFRVPGGFSVRRCFASLDNFRWLEAAGKGGSELLSQWSGVGQSGRNGGRVFLLGYGTAHNKMSP